MNQDKHLFQFSGAQIAEACRAEEVYSRERIIYWKAQQDELIAKAKDLKSVVKVTEQTMSGGGKHVTVSADILGIGDLNSHLYLAAQKIEGHRQRADTFKLKGAAYATNADRAYELDPADVAYFRLNGGDRDE
jgi:hypothetical protein